MPISVRATVNKLQLTSALTITLNCAAGGDWSATPQNGDFMLVHAYLQDDSGAPSFTPPGGWTNWGFNQGIAVDSPDALRRLASRRFATSPEATYTWTSTSVGQTFTVWLLQGVCLSGVLNPYGGDTGPFALTNQADRNPQAAPNLSVQLPDSVVVAGWGTNPQFTTPYASVAAINGVSATFIRDNNGFACLGCWLAPGVGIWTPTATRGVNGQGHWGALGGAIKAAPSGSPQRTLVGTGT